MTKRLSTLFSFLTLLLLVSAPAATAQSRDFRIDYTVEVASVEQQLFHVTADIQNIRQPSLDLSLPTWTPGWYTVENYAKNILRFQVTDTGGKRLPMMMARKQTWRIETRGLDRIKVEFDYFADVLALNQAKITKDFAFFTGTQLFLGAVGHSSSPSTVRFKVPDGWKVVSALKETTDPMTFTATDYDNLLDSPTEMGRFDVTRFEIRGKPHWIVTTPAGLFSKEKAEKLSSILTRIAEAQMAVFDDMPYEKYIYFYFFARAESNAAGALEHNNSFVAFGPPTESVQPERLMGVSAHEFFHLWNVKRLRPADMWPYDYSREMETPLLWVSEGFTNYYTNLSLLRAGLINREQFLATVGGAMTGVESNPARAYISPADASTSTWLGYDTRQPFEISYYTQGQNLGALLDLSIIRDTRGAARLDDVMRALYKDFYLRGRGFSTEDMLAVIKRLTKRDYHDFYRRYVWGIEVPPYDEILGFAGYRAEKSDAGYRVVEAQSQTPDQLKVREVWLRSR